MVRSTLLQVTRRRQNTPGGVPPLGIPGTTLTHDISGSSSSNETNSIDSNAKLCVDYDGINPIAVRQREHQEYFRFWSKSRTCRARFPADPGCIYATCSVAGSGGASVLSFEALAQLGVTPRFARPAAFGGGRASRGGLASLGQAELRRWLSSAVA